MSCKDPFDRPGRPTFPSNFGTPRGMRAYVTAVFTYIDTIEKWGIMMRSMVVRAEDKLDLLQAKLDRAHAELDRAHAKLKEYCGSKRPSQGRPYVLVPRLQVRSVPGAQVVALVLMVCRGLHLIV
jgi:hypothetical protein